MRATLYCIIIALSGFISTSYALAPEPVHKRTVTSVTEALIQGHYKELELDDQFSEMLFDRYFEVLDPSHAYFLQSDIDEFSLYRSALDDEIRLGQLTTAYAIYTRFLDRFAGRTQKLINKLESGVSFDFSSDEQVDLVREDANWFSTEAEQDAYWDKRIRSAMLNLKLAGRSAEEAVETLTKRYTNQLNRIEQTDSEDIFQTFTNVVASAFDPHTSYFSPQTSENFQINMSLSLEGIGAVLQTEDEFTKVVSLVPAGPADKQGQLKPADLIVGVGQGESGPIEDIVGLRLDDVVQKIRGPKDSVVRLEVIPATSADQTTRRVISLTRNRVQLEEQAAQSEVIEINRDGETYRLGIIDIPTFYIDFQALQRGDENYRSTTRDVKALIEELSEQQVDGLVIDLRDNGGGSLREANELIGLFISRGPTVQIRDASGRVDVLGDYDPDTAWTGPLTVIVNRLSASASEIFAGAIQDYRRGLVVGARTFGKGTVQTLQPLNHGQVKLTTAKFYRISGESTQNEGVTPDVWFPALIEEDEIGESALDFALPWDQVRPVRYGRYSTLDRWIPELTSRHQNRTAEDPDFNFMRAQIIQLEEQRAQTQITLNEEQLKRQRDQLEQQQVNLENERRMAKNLPPIEDLDELLAEAGEADFKDPNDQAILREASELTLDMIELFEYEEAQRRGELTAR